MSGDLVAVGRIAGLYGVRGWVRVYSYTEPRENVLRYTPWTLALGRTRRTTAPLEGRRHGRTVIARLEGVDDRDLAATLLGAQIEVSRAALPAPPPGEYYWADLIGLRVETAAGEALGTVERLLETGANDVLVVAGERERLIPWLPGRVVREVDLDGGRVVVDWDPEF